MSLISIDRNICKKDGFCVLECPLAIIRQADEESSPEMIPGGDEMCLVCGHCMAVCPHGALTHMKVPVEQSPPVSSENDVTWDQAVQFLRSRRSIRNFKNKPVEKSKIQELIEIARYAPTASNAQPLTWTVFTKKEDLNKLSELTVEWMRGVMASDDKASIPVYASMIVAAWDIGLDTILRNAPALVIASAPGNSRNGMVDLTIALSYLELIAPKMGLGTCWAGLLQNALRFSEPLRECIDLPESHTNHYPMMVGYPKFRYHRMPERKKPDIIWKD